MTHYQGGDLLKCLHFTLSKKHSLGCEIEDIGFEQVKFSYFKGKEMIIIFGKSAMSAISAMKGMS